MELEQARAREAIRYTQALCATAGDSGRLDDMVGAYTDDGVLEIAAGVFRGRAAIADALAHVRLRDAGDQDPADASEERLFVRHNLTTCHIEFTSAETARARTYFLVMSPVGLDHCGVYSDRFVASGSRWLIEYRRIRLDWVAPNSRLA
jgi:hypothetical protein